MTKENTEQEVSSERCQGAERTSKKDKGPSNHGLGKGQGHQRLTMSCRNQKKSARRSEEEEKSAEKRTQLMQGSNTLGLGWGVEGCGRSAFQKLWTLSERSLRAWAPLA